MTPHERACFYTDVQVAGEYVGFYYAVQEGGNFDVDFEILDPNGKRVISGMGERQTDIVFVGQIAGEYALCFSNVMSTFLEKLIDFDFSVEHELKETSFIKNELEKSVGKTNEKSGGNEIAKQIEGLKHIVESPLMGSISSIQRQQRIIRTVEHRGFAVVKATESRIIWFAIIESICMAAMGLFQVYAIQTFFSKSVRTRV